MLEPGGSSAQSTPRRESCFAITDVGGVFLGSYFITITKAGGDWPSFAPRSRLPSWKHFMSRLAVVTSGSNPSPRSGRVSFRAR